MSRPLRIQFPGAVYHVFARGNNRQSIFADAADRRRLLRLLWEVSDHFDWDILAYCLMGNHYHLLLETKLPTLMRGMRQLNGQYSRKFNYRHKRVGHVFQARYKAIVVQPGPHLLEVARYIVLNPVRADLCPAPEEWLWSSYPAMVGQTALPRHLVVQKLLSPFGGPAREAGLAFCRFVRAGIGSESGYDDQRTALAFGDACFVTELEKHAGQPSHEVRRAERIWKSLESFDADFPDRESAIRAAYQSGMYSRTAIAHHFAVAYSFVRKLTPSKSKKQT